jgi:hypothetical protein
MPKRRLNAPFNEIETRMESDLTAVQLGLQLGISNAT